jgi:hypothetical protein
MRGRSVSFFVSLPKDRSVERIIDVSQQVIVILAPKLDLFIISHEASLMVIEIGFVQWNLQWDGRDQRTFGVLSVFEISFGGSVSSRPRARFNSWSSSTKILQKEGIQTSHISACQSPRPPFHRRAPH